jgi:amidase
MPIQIPSAEQVLEIAKSFGMTLTEADARSFTGLMSGVALSYDRLDGMVEPKPKVKYARTTGARPAAAGDWTKM